MSLRLQCYACIARLEETLSRRILPSACTEYRCGNFPFSTIRGDVPGRGGGRGVAVQTLGPGCRTGISGRRRIDRAAGARPSAEYDAGIGLVRTRRDPAALHHRPGALAAAPVVDAARGIRHRFAAGFVVRAAAGRRGTGHWNRLEDLLDRGPGPGLVVNGHRAANAGRTQGTGQPARTPRVRDLAVPGRRRDSQSWR